MRKLPSVILGALLLPVGLLPTVAWADSIPTPLPTAVTSVSPIAPSPQPTVTTGPTATPGPTQTSDPTPPAPTATTTPEPTDPTVPPEEDFLSGTFVRTPGSGEPGTVITLKSKTLCVDSSGAVGTHVQVFMFDEADLEGEEGLPTVDQVITADAEGAWKTKVRVPRSAETGNVYYLIAGCFAAGVTVDEDALPFLIYDVQEFTVTPVDKAPVADPVPGDPNFTG